MTTKPRSLLVTNQEQHWHLVNSSNAELKADRRRRYRSRRENYVDDFEYEDVWRRDEGKCQRCGIQTSDAVGTRDPHKRSIDHSPPRSRVEPGHVYSINDVLTMCLPCNTKKGHLDGVCRKPRSTISSCLPTSFRSLKVEGS